MNPPLRSASLVLAFLLASAALLAAARTVQGDAAADRALQAAVARGQALWRKPWRPGAKPCMACHEAGPNAMTAARVKSYPKYDKALGAVVSVQQKLNQMITSKAGGQALALGSDDLNAIEAYLSSLR